MLGLNNCLNSLTARDQRRSRGRKAGALAALLGVLVITASCEIDTKLAVQGGNPPKFVMTGNGRLTSLRVRGPKKQREADGEDAFLYWVIESKEGGERVVTEISPIVYGTVPDGYIQVYPESGTAPSLVESERYYTQVITMNANGDGKYFRIRNSKVEMDP